MKSSAATSQIFNSQSIFNEYDTVSTGFYSKKQQINTLENLYYKCDDEPDFDCEFLKDFDADYNNDTINVTSENNWYQIESIYL